MTLATSSGWAGAQIASGSGALRLSAPRAAHSVVGLGDGSALFIGGCVEESCETGPASATVDRYDPQTRAITRLGHLVGPRTDGGPALLPDGGVLLAGGWTPEPTDTVERFDPKRGTSEVVCRMSTAQVCQAITLTDGRILLIGEKTIDVFDPATRRIRQLTAASPFIDSGTATLLTSGQVLIAGGGLHGPPRADAFLFDPVTGKSQRTGSLGAIRRKHAAVRLDDGKVLVIGGSDQRDRAGGKTKALELYDPATGRFSHVGDTIDARFKIVHAAVKLGDGRVVVAGGALKPEIIDPKTWKSRAIDIAIGDILNFATAVALPNGDVLVAGGYGEHTISLTDRAWLIPRAAMA
jgi:hypothetical protein